jgi:hypothetical protein
MGGERGTPIGTITRDKALVLVRADNHRDTFVETPRPRIVANIAGVLVRRAEI